MNNFIKSLINRLTSKRRYRYLIKSILSLVVCYLRDLHSILEYVRIPPLEILNYKASFKLFPRKSESCVGITITKEKRHYTYKVGHEVFSSEKCTDHELNRIMFDYIITTIQNDRRDDKHTSLI